MSHLSVPLLAVFLLSACSGPALVEDTSTTTPGTGTSVDVPAAIKGDLTSFSYTGTSLTFTGLGLDQSSQSATYTRNAALDVDGFLAYSQQEDPLDRLFIGLAARSSDGAATAVVGADGGQFNRWIHGASYARNGAYDAPALGNQDGQGLVSYAGSYAGLWNGGISSSSPSSVLLPVDADSDPSVRPNQAARVTGSVFLNADFRQNAVNGVIYRRSIDDTGVALPDVVLVKTGIDSNGAFSGGAEWDDRTPIGSYAGVFAGTNSKWATGGIYLTDVIDTVEDELEVGVFLLEQCSSSADPACVDASEN